MDLRARTYREIIGRLSEMNFLVRKTYTVSFEKISLTARLTAYMRQYSDIPFAKDVANLLQAEAAFEKLLGITS